VATVTPELEAIVAEAEADPAGFVTDVLENPAKLAVLAMVKKEDHSAFEWLLAKFRQAKVAHLTNLRSAVTKASAAMNGHEPPPPPPTATEILDQLRQQIDEDALGFEDTATLLDDIVAFVSRYVSFLDPAQADAVALWICHTWAIDCFDISPRLSVQAPQPQAGKTRLLEAAASLAFRPRMWILPSPAVVYRTLDMGPTCLMLDEIDAVFRGRNAEKHDELRAILNEGYARSGTVPRMVPDDEKGHWKVVEFPVFAPVAMAGIGRVHDTLESRSIVVRLHRQSKRNRAMKFRRREVEPRAKVLRDRLVLWAGVHADELRRARPRPPKGMSDRAEDIWEPLFAISEVAGDEWRKRADKAALFFAARAADGTDDVVITLLRDIRTIFDAQESPRIFTTALLERLVKIEDSPWGTWGSGRRRDPGLNAADLARMLKDFDITPKPLRIGEAAGIKGYERADFEDLWDRYLSPDREGGVDPC
jgi:hypothetical protein